MATQAGLLQLQPQPTGGILAPLAAPTQPDNATGLLAGVSKMYPGLAPYVGNTVVKWGEPSGPDDDRQLEFYAPSDPDNPNPGKSTVELYNRKLQGDDATDSVALDMLHYVGGLDPATGKPVSPAYYALKQQVKDQVVKRNAPFDQEAYRDDVKRYGPQSYDDWLNHNRVDAYIRALVSPRMNPEWQEPGVLTAGMKLTGAQITAMLKGAQK